MAEITHPDAPPTARFSYENGWADPEQENQPPELWDRLVIPIAEQVQDLGEPVDRPVFGGADGSEPFNSFGGMQDVYFQDELFTAVWTAVFEDEEGVKKAYFFRAVTFTEEVVAEWEPIVYAEADGLDFNQVSEDAADRVRELAAEEGWTECERC
ncbi:hypothetical protein [Euzebya tangerina]|uniref:hypothetical protein n=1 Tax=Euzebya tangerina TaxID=591198 RepID=UPI0013C301CD|nr:hypothetical protein [Euzebya tangerina]